MATTLAPIKIRGNVLDPAHPGGIDLPTDASGSDHVLVQLSKAMDDDILDALEEAEAKVVKRMEGNTWLLNYPHEDLEKLRSIGGVEYALVYVNHFVVAQNLRPSSDDPEDIPMVSVLLHEDARASTEETLATIRDLPGVEVQTAGNGLIQVQVTSQEALNSIAALDTVQAIERAVSIAPMNDRIMELSGIQNINKFLVGSGKNALTGAGEIVTVADSGVDTSHEAFQGKVASKYHVKQRTDSDDNFGHGTHVAGTVLGAPVKYNNDQEVTGVAPGAQLKVQGILFDPNADWTSEDLFEDAYNGEGGKSYIHSNSWGTPVDRNRPVQLGYQAPDAERIDKWALENPEVLIVRSAGNDGRLKTVTKAQVQTFAVSKNVLTVGATYTDRQVDMLDRVNPTDEDSESKLGKIAPFSSRGPVKTTGRTKPDIVAPGVCILSTRSSSAQAQPQFKKWTQSFGQPQGGWKPADKFIFCSGTSMATPAVSGFAALLRQALREWQGITTPSAPLMKALLTNGTNDLGVSSALQGFGEINLDKVLNPVRQREAEATAGNADANASATSAGFAEGAAKRKDPPVTRTTTSPTPGEPGKKVNLQVTLVYHDAPGDVIQNYMNLSVESTLGTKETYSPTNPENVHRILISDVPAGTTFTIGVQPKLVAVGSVPWGLVWNHFES